MKVLHILHGIERSGLESMLLCATEAFDAAGVETHVLGTGAAQGELAKEFRVSGYTVHHAPFRVATGYFHQLYALMRRERFDVVHIHTEQAFFWYGLTARVAGVPRVVHHVHAYFPFEGPLRVERILQRWLGRALLGMKSLAVSPSVAANERTRFLNPSTLIGNWVDAVAFHPISLDQRVALRKHLALPASASLIVSVGACVPLKNHELIVESMVLVERMAPGVHYVHVGTGSEEAAEQALAQHLGVHALCHFLGARGDVAHVLAACDLMVMPSDREGLPMAALEALSCGLPVVATDVPGLRDVVINERTGVLVDANAESVAVAVTRMLADPALRQRLGAEGRRRVIERHSPDAGVAAWLEVYRG